MIKFICTILLAFLSTYSILADTLTGKVIKITDGDTVHVLQANHIKEKIRLAGIDAPERKQPHGSNYVVERCVLYAAGILTTTKC